MPRSYWRNRVPSLLVAAAIAAVFGLASGWLTPRGPTTSLEALLTMAGGAIVGFAAGAFRRSRWSLLLAPAAFVVALEVARLGAVGPTVDGLRLGSLFGIIALVLGRGLDYLLALLPMAIGAIVGIGLTSRSGDRSKPIGAWGWTFTGVAAAGLVALAVAIAIPASTAPVLAGESPNSIAELIDVEIGGHRQAMMIRGRNADAPVLLYLAGGPGGTDIGAVRRDVGLEQDFVVAVWEQRGAGKSYSALDPAETLTLEQLISDTIDATNYLRERFDEDRIYLVGNSWGTTLAALAVQRRPELFHAYVGTGQMVSQNATDRLFYEDALAWAEATGNEGLAAALVANGPPPYDDIWKYEPIVNSEHDWNAYPGFNPDQEMPAILFVPEYTLLDKLNAFPAFLDSASIVYPQIQDVDLRQDVPGLEVPVYIIQGEHEARGRAILALEWFDVLEAPAKEFVVFEASGHRPHFERPGEFAETMRRVLDETYPR